MDPYTQELVSKLKKKRENITRKKPIDDTKTMSDQGADPNLIMSDSSGESKPIPRKRRQRDLDEDPLTIGENGLRLRQYSRSEATHQPSFFCDEFPMFNSVEAEAGVNYSSLAMSLKVEEEANSLTQPQKVSFRWDPILRRLLCACIVLVGTRPKDIKKKCFLFDEIQNAQLRKETEKMLMMKGV